MSAPNTRKKNIYLGIAFFVLFASAVTGLILVLHRSSWNDSQSPGEGATDCYDDVIYQVYPRSFRDDDGDGLGDLAGITSRLSYLKALGVGTVWVSPFFKSPMADFGYDISDFTAVDPTFGTMEDFDTLITEAHSLGLKLVMDLVPNHSSDEHDWFQNSVRQEAPYADYYVWAPAKGYNNEGEPIPPNNWLSVFGGSAWTWNSIRGEFYLHQFLDRQPDLNYNCQHVQEEMQNVIKFWMDKGVDGMRLDAVKFLFEVDDLSLDEPLSAKPNVQDPTEYDYLEHLYTTDQPATFDVIRNWRLLLDQYPDSKVMLAEVYYDNMAAVMKYYGTEADPLADFPFNFNFISDFRNRSEVTGFSLRASVGRWLDNMPEGMWPNWVLGNHDTGRLSSRLGADLQDACNMVALLLPGTAVTYYGEEIGMEDAFISFEDTRDPAGCRWGPDRYQEFSRDPARTPMQWDQSPGAGFTEGNSSWLPIHPNHVTVNVAAQQKADQSTLKVYQSLARLRQEQAFRSLNIAYPKVTDEVFSFVRYLTTEITYIIVVNTSLGPVKVNLLAGASFELPASAEVVLRSSSDARPSTKPGTVLELNDVTLIAGEGIVLRSLQTDT